VEPAAIEAQQPSLGLNYVINTEGVFPGGNLTLNSLGVVSAFAGNFAPGDELFCDGQLLPISEYSALFNLIGTTPIRRWARTRRSPTSSPVS
jgi:microcystin-dependent protein